MYSMYFFQHILFELVCFFQVRSAVYTQTTVIRLMNGFVNNLLTKSEKSRNENFCKKKCLKLFQESSINDRSFIFGTTIKRLK